MARKVEIINPVEMALESDESDDVKAKMILQALYNINKMHQPRASKVVTSLQSQTTSSPQTDSVIPKEKKKITDELSTNFTWGADREIIYGGRKMRGSNITELVEYLAQGKKRQTWYNKVSRILLIHKLRANRQKPLSWERYGEHADDGV